MKYVPNPTPNGQGVYLLVHRPTKSVYVGSSTNLRGRVAEWKSTMLRNPKKLAARLPSTDHEEWEFIVAQRTEGMTEQELRNAEAEKITSAKNMGMNVLNISRPQSRKTYEVDGLTGSATFHATRLGKIASGVTEKLNRGYTIEQALGLEDAPPSKWTPDNARELALSMMPVALIGSDNQRLTYTEAAMACGVSADTMRERVKRARKQDPSLTAIQISQA